MVLIYLWQFYFHGHTLETNIFFTNSEKIKCIHLRRLYLFCKIMHIYPELFFAKKIVYFFCKQKLFFTWFIFTSTILIWRQMFSNKPCWWVCFGTGENISRKYASGTVELLTWQHTQLETKMTIHVQVVLLPVALPQSNRVTTPQLTFHWSVWH